MIHKLVSRSKKNSHKHRKSVANYSKSNHTKMRNNMKGTRSMNNKRSKRGKRSIRNMRNMRVGKPVMRGGSADCTLATVLEPSFNISDIGSVKGLSIPESRSIIYRPNCRVDSNQPMVPAM
jgi:hypothetical protein